jgi:hypothetical protein
MAAMRTEADTATIAPTWPRFARAAIIGITHVVIANWPGCFDVRARAAIIRYNRRRPLIPRRVPMSSVTRILSDIERGDGQAA